MGERERRSLLPLRFLVGWRLIEIPALFDLGPARRGNVDRRGGSERRRSRGESDALEDASGDVWILDRRDEAQRGTAAGTAQRIEAEDAL